MKGKIIDAITEFDRACTKMPINPVMVMSPDQFRTIMKQIGRSDNEIEEVLKELQDYEIEEEFEGEL